MKTPKVEELTIGGVSVGGGGAGQAGGGDNVEERRCAVGSLQEYVLYQVVLLSCAACSHFSSCINSPYQFAQNVAGNLAPQTFPVSEVHKIAILDIRMANTDRNEANVLVKRVAQSPVNALVDGRFPLGGKRAINRGMVDRGGAAGGLLLNNRYDESIRLVPIDHAYSLPDTLEITWADWY